MHFGVPTGAWKIGEAGGISVDEDEDDKDEGLDSAGVYSGNAVPGF
jgi:hypothetical protein